MPRIRTVDQQVSDLQQRISGLETLQVFTYRVQTDQLAKAEQLRRLALNVVHAFDRADGRGGLRALKSLRAYVTGLDAFSVPRGRVPAPLRRLLREHSGIKRAGRR